MDTFFAYLKKGLVAMVFVVFGFVFTYIPQPYNQVEEVYAGGLSGNIATETTQILNNIQQAAINVATTASAGFNSVTAFATENLWTKEFFLDGIAWAVAKAIVQQLVASLVDWINSGFEGRPMFLQDMTNFLLEVSDVAIGEYIAELGDVGSFICAPFRLDVQFSVSVAYDQGRNNQPAPTCTLSGIIDNIEGFLDGTFSEGGWNDWIDITSQPSVYTPYGAILAANSEARARIINAQGEEVTLLDFGDGFLSGELCEIIDGEEECFITKPGKIVEEALSFNLDSGRQSLITADEFNEIIAALLGQLANRTLQGAAGLLGLSGGTGYTYSSFEVDGETFSGPFTDELSRQTVEAIDAGAAQAVIEDDRNTQQRAAATASSQRPALAACAASGNRNCQQLLQQTDQIIANTNASIPELNAILTSWPTASPEEQNGLIERWAVVDTYSSGEVDAYIASVNSILGNTEEPEIEPNELRLELDEETTSDFGERLNNLEELQGVEDPNVINQNDND